MSGSPAQGMTYQQIVEGINRIAKNIEPYNRNDEYDNGHILGENVFGFFPRTMGRGGIYGTVTAARFQENPKQIYVTVARFNERPIELSVSKERAAQIYYKMQRTEKYILFILKQYTTHLEKREQEYRDDLLYRISQHGVRIVKATEMTDILNELQGLQDLKQNQQTTEHDSQIQHLKWKLRAAEEFFAIYSQHSTKQIS
jgi:hypothetical protein